MMNIFNTKKMIRRIDELEKEIVILKMTNQNLEFENHILEKQAEEKNDKIADLEMLCERKDRELAKIEEVMTSERKTNGWYKKLVAGIFKNPKMLNSLVQAYSKSEEEFKSTVLELIDEK